MGGPAPDIPASQSLEIGERGRAAEAALREARFSQQIEVVSHEPDDTGRYEIGEQLRAHLVVVRRAYRFSHVVQEGRGPERAIVGRSAGQIEDLERVKEGVTLGVVDGILANTIQSEQQRQ